MTNVGGGDQSLPTHPERLLAVVHAPRLARESLATLFVLDERLGGIVVQAKEPQVALIRLTWWRDALAALDDEPPPAEPLLHAAAALRPDRISGADLAGVAEGWSVLLDAPDLGWDDAMQHAVERGAGLFRLVAQVLGETSSTLESAGKGWALADLARQARDPAKSAMLLDLARPLLDTAFAKPWPARLRSLGMLAALAREDARRGADALRPPASRGRLLRLLMHRWTGR